MPGIPLRGGLEPIDMRVANTSSTESVSGGYICEDA